VSSQTLLAIGDSCGPPHKNPGAAAVAALAAGFVAADPTIRILLLGDNAYNRGSHQDYADFYDPVLGIPLLKSRSHPCPGNHDYKSDGGAAYFRTFGAAAGSPTKSFYSFDLECGWHVVSLNTEIEHDERSPQLSWLRDDLATRKQPAILAFWHRARWGSGGHRDSRKPRWFWRELFKHRGELIICGHSHHYEQFHPQNPEQTADPQGIRQFIVGCSGRSLKRRTKNTPNSDQADFARFGLLKLILSPARYEWQFVATDGTVPFSGTSPTNLH